MGALGRAGTFASQSPTSSPRACVQLPLRGGVVPSCWNLRQPLPRGSRRQRGDGTGLLLAFSLARSLSLSRGRDNSRARFMPQSPPRVRPRLDLTWDHTGAAPETTGRATRGFAGEARDRDNAAEGR